MHAIHSFNFFKTNDKISDELTALNTPENPNFALQEIIQISFGSGIAFQSPLNALVTQNNSENAFNCFLEWRVIVLSAITTRTSVENDSIYIWLKFESQSLIISMLANRTNHTGQSDIDYHMWQVGLSKVWCSTSSSYPSHHGQQSHHQLTLVHLGHVASSCDATVIILLEYLTVRSWGPSNMLESYLLAMVTANFSYLTIEQLFDCN